MPVGAEAPTVSPTRNATAPYRQPRVAESPPPGFLSNVRRHRSLLRDGLALLALSGFLLGGVFEPALGLLRDGRVHHETTATAGVHGNSTPTGEHGHEDGTASGPSHTHAPDHQHGTSADHCTHAHGAGIVPAQDFSFALAVVHVDEWFVAMASLSPRQIHSPPPRV